MTLSDVHNAFLCFGVFLIAFGSVYYVFATRKPPDA